MRYEYSQFMDEETEKSQDLNTLNAMTQPVNDTTMICYIHSMPKAVLFITKLFDVTVILTQKQEKTTIRFSYLTARFES